jgi:hypothetical protein
MVFGEPDLEVKPQKDGNRILLARAIPTSGSSALRAEVDEAAWSALYSTKSYPFDPPTSGKIAVKVINHYGDEVLKVYPVGKG